MADIGKAEVSRPYVRVVHGPIHVDHLAIDDIQVILSKQF